MHIGALWIAIGAAGVLGAWAGTLVGRFGIDRVHRIFLAVLAAGTLAVGSSLATPASALVGGALFGAAYVMPTGIYLVWGVAGLPDQPAAGLTVGFLTIAVGQAVGAPLFGLLMDRFGADPAVIAVTCLGLSAGLLRTERAGPPGTGIQAGGRPRS